MDRRVEIRLLRVARPPAQRRRSAPRAARGQDPGVVRGVRRHLRVSPHPRRTPPRRRACRRRAGPSADARTGPGSGAAQAVPHHHRARPGRTRDRRPPPAGLLCRPARDQGRRRHHLYPDVAGLAVFGDADRLFQPRGDRLVHGRPLADRIGHRRAGHGRAESSARTGLYYAFRPRYAIHVCRISGDPDSAWVAAFGRADRSMLG